MTFRRIREKYLNRETFFYLLFGILTTAVNYGVYYLCRYAGIDYRITNVIAWIAAVIFAFITNKLFVFESRSTKFHVLLREIMLFAGARLFSLAVEELLLLLGVELIELDDRIVKLIAAVFVIIINYFFSKYFIFNKKEQTDEEEPR